MSDELQKFNKKLNSLSKTLTNRAIKTSKTALKNEIISAEKKAISEIKKTERKHISEIKKYEKALDKKSNSVSNKAINTSITALKNEAKTLEKQKKIIESKAEKAKTEIDEAKILAELEHEMLRELKNIRESDDFKDSVPEFRKKQIAWVKATEKKVGKTAKRMLNLYKKDNPKNYLAELSRIRADGLNEFLYEDRYLQYGF